MNNTDLRNEYARLKNKAFDQGCEGGFRADYTEWLEQKLANNTEIIGSVINFICADKLNDVKDANCKEQCSFCKTAYKGCS